MPHGAIAPQERAAVRARRPVGAKYDSPVNRESAYEILGRQLLRGLLGSSRRR